MDLVVSAVKSLRSLAKESRERFVINFTIVLLDVAKTIQSIVNLKSTKLGSVSLKNLHFVIFSFH